VIGFLQLKELQTFRLVSSQWECVSTNQMRNRDEIHIAFHNEVHLVHFLNEFKSPANLPTYNFRITDHVLFSPSVRQHLVQFSRTFGMCVRGYNLTSRKSRFAAFSPIQLATLVVN